MNKIIFKFISLLIIGWSVINCININTMAANKNNRQKKLSQIEAHQLLDDVQYLLSSEETIDYDDPKLNGILNRRKDEYDLFKIYKAFIDFDKSEKNKNDIARAKKVIIDYHRKKRRYFDGFNKDSVEESIMSHFLDLISIGILADDIAHLLPGEREENWDNGFKYIKIPLWLVLKYPEVVHMDGVYTLTVNAKNSIKDLKEYENFLANLANIHTGYISYMFGLQEINSYLNTKNFIDIASFAPDVYLNYKFSFREWVNKNSQEQMLPLEKWSFSEVANRPFYEQLVKSIHEFSIALSKYYQTNYNLAKYSNQAENIISYYVYNLMDSYIRIYYDPKIVEIMVQSGYDKMDQLKPLIEALDIDRRSEFLHHAVAANLDINFIKWLIKIGVDINYKFNDETLLMASFRSPEIMQLLLKNGAKTEMKNWEKETALHIAIKFNNLDTVKILIDNGAEVNPTTKTEPKLHRNEKLSFTPLIYAKRYASEEIIDLLIKHGAEEGPNDSESLREWINLGPYKPKKP